MPNPYFSFKQFTVYHDRCAMKVGIDGVLLGVWASVDAVTDVLDIGTGTGLIALMIAQRSLANIDAIDIEPQAALQATVNASHSPWSDRVHVQEVSLQDFAETATQRYDLIVSNPPYFVNSTKAPCENRSVARHADGLTHEELILLAILLLKPNGRICLILPVVEGLQCAGFALKNGLYCSKQVTVFPKPNAAAKRLLLEFSLQPCVKLTSELIIETEQRHHYSEDFTLLAKNFYLKL